MRFLPLLLAVLAIASETFATPEARVGNVRVSSDLPIVVMPDGMLNPHLKPTFVALGATKPMRVDVRDAAKTSRHTPTRPDRTVLVEVVFDGHRTEFSQFPFPIAMDRGEVYNVERIQQEFGYKLYLALKMVASGDRLLTDADGVDHRFAAVATGVAGLRRGLPRMPGVLQFTLPPFLEDLGQRMRAASAGCVDALVGQPASLATRAVLVVDAEQQLLSVMNQVAQY